MYKLLLPLLAGCSLPVAPTSDLHGTRATDRGEFFEEEGIYLLSIRGWDASKLDSWTLAEDTTVDGAVLTIHEIDPDLGQPCPDEVSREDLVHETTEFELRSKGGFTQHQDKFPLKVTFTKKSHRLFGMKKINLNAMINDVSQMREAISWDLMDDAGVIAAQRHAYARVCIDGRYFGLYSLLEQVDERMIEDRFPESPDGNLYKANWADLGPATLAWRGDKGSDYWLSDDLDDRTYELKTNDDEDDDPALQTYDDLALFVRTLHGVDLPGEGAERYNSAVYTEALEAVFDVDGFLRWAALNMLLGAWDNYYATPSNYYLYNAGTMQEPYFHFVPHDYDHTFGIDYFGVAWQHHDIVDWQDQTELAHGSEADLPLVRILLMNDGYRAAYLDHMQHLLDTSFAPEHVLALRGTEGSGGLWDKVRTSAYLESDSSWGAPYTGRHFTNDQIYWNGFEGYELDEGYRFIPGLEHYTRMRAEDARWQIEVNR